MKGEEEKLAKDYISFFQGQDNLITDEDDLNAGILKIKNKVSDLSNIKNVHFLLGAGASSGSIPAMKTMLDKIIKRLESKQLKEELSKSYKGDDLDKKVKNYKLLFEKINKKESGNLEKILGTLYSLRSYREGAGYKTNGVIVLITLIETEIYDQINIDLETDSAAESLNIYQRLYQKLSLRNKDLARVNVFTTNNDLLSEKALDYLNINYNNGFGGGLTRVFNPARFSYTFSRKVDTNLEKYEPLVNMVYLYKLHGSISWVESEDNSFFNIKEVAVTHGDRRPDENVLIYPTPLKQNKSLGSPYADLIREFQKKLLLPNSVLFVIGYSFSDEHINNIIYQAMASNPSISIVVFGDYKNENLFKVEDRRVYKISGYSGEIDENGDKERIHYFKYIINNLIPDLDQNKDADLLKDFLRNIKKLNNPNGETS
ncbi:SIR2 family protein [Cocleimonas sp. KMM 6892]|uniref:SIR2 family protein n=1 Tax=unclassified Cocleimonas TaxID=2639732 RepID=UPI002DBB054B|nr:MULTISPECIES: SIR2 family protein [unclassified Cocleimonas]MEB8431120.1 SIR2 family protein [Cocleimonas sp. KMM 6892]MEC4714108.1 SIR2 family protein [Cocleimonas sp. KMM 6895]MEC4743439.1 SIR2 family protein [Cocleimonas sp. KMM 6896]